MLLIVNSYKNMTVRKTRIFLLQSVQQISRMKKKKKEDWCLLFLLTIDLLNQTNKE